MDHRIVLGFHSILLLSVLGLEFRCLDIGSLSVKGYKIESKLFCSWDDISVPGAIVFDPIGEISDETFAQIEFTRVCVIFYCSYPAFRIRFKKQGDPIGVFRGVFDQIEFVMFFLYWIALSSYGISNWSPFIRLIFHQCNYRKVWMDCINAENAHSFPSSGVILLIERNERGRHGRCGHDRFSVECAITRMIGRNEMFLDNLSYYPLG